MKKDLLVEVRGKEIVLAVSFFVLLMVFTFNFAFKPGSVPTEIMTPGVLWFTFLFAGMLSFQRVVSSEQENGCLDGLMLCPVWPGRDLHLQDHQQLPIRHDGRSHSHPHFRSGL